MKTYTEELEAQIDSLKEALSEERLWHDFRNNRIESQKYRRWCISKTTTAHIVPQLFKFKTVPKTVKEYIDTVWLNLEDARSYLRAIISDIDDYVSPFVEKAGKSKYGKADKIWQSVVSYIDISLFDQKRGKNRYLKRFSIETTYNPISKRVTTLLRDIEPGQIQLVDECLLSILEDDSTYVAKWKAMMEKRVGVRCLTTKK